MRKGSVCRFFLGSFALLKPSVGGRFVHVAVLDHRLVDDSAHRNRPRVALELRDVGGV